MPENTPPITRTRRAALAGGAALILGAAAAQTLAAQEAPTFTTSATGATWTAAGPGDVTVFAAGQPIDLDKKRTDWLKAVADRLGSTPDKVQSAMQDASKDVGLPGVLAAPFPAAMSSATKTFTVQLDPPQNVAAKALSMTPEQLRKEQRGRSLTEVAKAHNIDPKVVAEALKAQRRNDLDKAIGQGSLDAAMAARLREHLDEDIERLMDLPGLGGEGMLAVRAAQLPKP